MNDLNRNIMNQHQVENTTLMQELMAHHQVLNSLIDDRPIHYVDIPVHGNIGDLLILHGTLAFFSKHQIKPKVTSPAFSYNPDWLDNGEAIVFHGGGNFGDLYAEYGMQPLREYVAESRPDNRIVILPQTIYFSSVHERQRSARIFRKHSDIHICVRDQVSYQIAQEFSDYVYLLPDMAHQLYPIRPVESVSAEGVLLVSRTDDEKNETGGEFNARTTTDWPLLVADSERHIDSFRRAMNLMHKYRMGWLGNKVLSPLWEAYSESLTKRAVASFSAHDHIVTDRLHGHILACLMDKPSTVIDNSYGKNSSYVSQWTLNSPLVSLQKI